MKDMKGRVAVVSGSSRGIGFEIAKYLLERGVRVVLNGRNQERLGDARNRLDPEGSTTLAIPGDMRSEEDVLRLVQETVEAWGGIDILVCNAALMMRGAFGDLNAEVVQSVVTTNIIGVANPIIKLLPELRKRRGSIIIISSLAAIRGMPHISLYCATKMALTAIAQSLWAELSGTGVHVGLLFVGITENDPDKRLLGADGSPVRVKVKAHSSQRDVAAKVYGQIKRRRRKIVMTPAGKALVFVNWLMPRFLTFVISKAQKLSARVANWE